MVIFLPFSNYLSNRRNDLKKLLALISSLRYSDTERARIGNYAHKYGIAAAAKHYTRELKLTVTETTVRDVYRQNFKLRRQCGINDPIRTLPEKKRGRPLLLGKDLDKKLQLYVVKQCSSVIQGGYGCCPWNIEGV